MVNKSTLQTATLFPIPFLTPPTPEVERSLDSPTLPARVATWDHCPSAPRDPDSLLAPLKLVCTKFSLPPTERVLETAPVLLSPLFQTLSPVLPPGSTKS